MKRTKNNSWLDNFPGFFKQTQKRATIEAKRTKTWTDEIQPRNTNEFEKTKSTQEQDSTDEEKMNKDPQDAVQESKVTLWMVTVFGVLITSSLAIVLGHNVNVRLNNCGNGFPCFEMNLEKP